MKEKLDKKVSPPFEGGETLLPRLLLIQKA
jgi:hypothetical protein